MEPFVVIVTDFILLCVFSMKIQSLGQWLSLSVLLIIIAFSLVPPLLPSTQVPYKLLGKILTLMLFRYIF